MTNFEIQNTGNYHYYSGKIGKVVRVSVEYDEGYTDYFGTTPKGIYVSMTPVEISEKIVGRWEHTIRKIEIDYGSERSGGRGMVTELKRKNQYKLRLIAEDLDSYVVYLVSRWEAGDTQTVQDILRNLKNRWS